MIDLYKKMRLDEFLVWAQVGLDNVRNIAEIAASMAAFGYDAPRIQEGVNLLAQARQLQAAVFYTIRIKLRPQSAESAGRVALLEPILRPSGFVMPA